jgi:hypothetical protein
VKYVDRVLHPELRVIDRGAELGKPSCGSLRDTGDLGIDFDEAEIGAPADAAGSDTAIDAVGEAFLLFRQALPIARVRLGDEVEHEGGIDDAARHRAGMGHIAEGAGGIGGHPGECGLQPEYAAERGRNADRAAAIGADMEGAHAEGRGDGRTSARAAGRLALVPGIARHMPERIVGDALPAALGCRGFADEYRARVLEPRRARRILHPGARRIDRGGTPHGGPAPGQAEILDRGRDAIDDAQRLVTHPAGFGNPRLSHSLFRLDEAKGPELGIQRIDAGKRAFDRVHG